MKNNANTIDSPAVMSKTIQQKPIIKQCKSVQITFPFFYFNYALRYWCFNRNKRKIMQTHYIRQLFLWTMYNEIQSSRSVKCSNYFLFFYFNSTLRCYTRIKKRKIMLTHYNHQQLFRKYTKKFHHHGVFKCTNYFSSFLFQQHNEVLQQNKKKNTVNTLHS